MLFFLLPQKEVGAICTKHQPMLVASLIVTGTGLQEHGNPNTEEDVAAKHENQADSVRYPDSFDPHHCSLSLQGIQLWKVREDVSIVML